MYTPFSKPRYGQHILEKIIARALHEQQKKFFQYYKW